MKYLKNHIFLIFALVSILFSIETYFVFNKIVSTYEEKIVKNYTMLIVSKTKIDKLDFKNISKIEQIDIKDSLDKVKQQFNNFHWFLLLSNIVMLHYSSVTMLSNIVLKAS